MPRTEEQFEQIRKEKKKLIMDVALELFASNGFHATSISQITKKAGVSKGLVYNYFESKSDILTEVIDEGFKEVQDLMDPNHDGIVTDEEFVSFIDKSFSAIANDLRHWKLFYSLMLQPTIAENFTEKYAQVAEPLFKMMYAFIASKGSKNPEGDLMIISSMIEGALLYIIVASGIFSPETLKQNVIDGIFRIIESGKKE